MRFALALCLSGCTFVGSPKPAFFDRDDDGVLAEEDCNDGDPTLSRLEADGVLACGDVVDDQFPILEELDRLQVFNCAHETDPDDLVSLKGTERVYQFRNEAPTDVRVWLDGVHPQSNNHYILANRGPWCTMENCALGRRSDDSVDFYAAPNEGWYIIVSQGTTEWDFTLTVDCITP